MKSRYRFRSMFVDSIRKKTRPAPGHHKGCGPPCRGAEAQECGEGLNTTWWFWGWFMACGESHKKNWDSSIFIMKMVNNGWTTIRNGAKKITWFFTNHPIFNPIPTIQKGIISHHPSHRVPRHTTACPIGFATWLHSENPSMDLDSS